MEDELRLFYFLAYPRGERDKITVIELDAACAYERAEWDCVSPEDFNDRDEAIRHARALCAGKAREYEMFESRYGGPDEYLGEFKESAS
jgi:hypothetical protein